MPVPAIVPNPAKDASGLIERVIAHVPQARVGDYVIVHVGHAIGVLDVAQAERTLALLGEVSAAAAPRET